VHPTRKLFHTAVSDNYPSALRHIRRLAAAGLVQLAVLGAPSQPASRQSISATHYIQSHSPAACSGLVYACGVTPVDLTLSGERNYREFFQMMRYTNSV